ncbi:eCIS core domain-containing protein [Natronobiforma cellulositropha]|uniref:eCIS core domain-containing protein n=1 Tax=Natronobiforma cellulositropha TaxID=1679076 RepID=UPI0021D59371|nr:DUF4157 domain-containing protein [Natronobiforma cellulositropha]
MSFDRDRRDRPNDDSERNERTRRARVQPQGARPHQNLPGVTPPSLEHAAELDDLVGRYGYPQVADWAERGELKPGCNTPTGEEVRVARARSASAGVDLDTESAMRSVEAQGESDLAGETATPDVVRRVISQPGRPLEGAVRDEMEQRMGDSFSDVQLHTGPEAAKAASALEARAFTTGNHVVFNRGEYDPGSAEGKYLLAHELAHVRQQTGGQISMLPQEGSSLVIDPDPELEREADEVARKALEGDPIVAHRLGMDVHVQRLSIGDDGPQQSTLDAFEDGEFDGTTADDSTLGALLERLDPREALRDSGRDMVEDQAESDTVVGAAANLLALVGVSGPIWATTGQTEVAAGAHVGAAAVIKRVGAEPIRSLSSASAGQVYDLLVDVGYKQLAEAWAGAVQRVHGDETDQTEDVEERYE